MTYIQKTICPYDCPTSCGLLAETDGKEILSVRGDKTHPANQGLILRQRFLILQKSGSRYDADSGLGGFIPCEKRKNFPLRKSFNDTPYPKSSA